MLPLPPRLHVSVPVLGSTQAWLCCSRMEPQWKERKRRLCSCTKAWSALWASTLTHMIKTGEKHVSYYCVLVIF